MTNEEFNNLFEERVQMCREVLCKKADEYADGDKDRLHNFTSAAGMNNTTRKDALWGMATKHFISLSDMCRAPKEYPAAMWNEKIGDALNYLFLLNAVITEDELEDQWGDNMTAVTLCELIKKETSDEHS